MIVDMPSCLFQWGDEVLTIRSACVRPISSRPDVIKPYNGRLCKQVFSKTSQAVGWAGETTNLGCGMRSVMSDLQQLTL